MERGVHRALVDAQLPRQFTRCSSDDVAIVIRSRAQNSGKLPLVERGRKRSLQARMEMVRLDKPHALQEESASTYGDGKTGQAAHATREVCNS